MHSSGEVSTQNRRAVTDTEKKCVQAHPWMDGEICCPKEIWKKKQTRQL